MQSCLALFLTTLDNSNVGVHFTFLFLVVLDLQLLIKAKLDHCSHTDQFTFPRLRSAVQLLIPEVKFHGFH